MKTIIEALTEVFHYRELLWALTLRDLQIRYKQSLLGIAWAIFTPLSMMLMFTLFNEAKILNIDTGNAPYVVFAYCGILPWTFFSSSLQTATASLVSNYSLVTKVYFPREVFPFSVIMAKAIDFFIASSILVVLMLIYHIPVKMPIVMLPAVLLIQVIFMTGMALLLSMGNLFYRDVKYIMDAVMILWMFATSVIYPIHFNNPVLQTIFNLNPMTPVINAYRNILIHGEWPNMITLVPAAVLSLVLFLGGLSWFHQNEFKFAEKI